MATDKKLVRSKSGLKIVALDDNSKSPFLLPEPQWIPDNQCKNCIECKTKFDFIKRRHHCRRCGNCFCGACCESKLALPRMCFVDPVRLCQKCFQTTQKENEFFDKHLKTLVNGGSFSISSSSLADQVSDSAYLCKLSSSHRYMQLEGETEVESIDLATIEAVQILTSGTDPQGNVVATGLSITYKDSCGEVHNIKMVAPENSQKKQSMFWVAAMQKAFKLLYESRGNSRNFVE